MSATLKIHGVSSSLRFAPAEARQNLPPATFGCASVPRSRPFQARSRNESKGGGAVRSRSFDLTPGGIRLVAECHPGILSASVGLFFGCGSRHETKSLHGATHLAEHLFFKGTSKRSAEEISELFERHGGDVNGFTDRELTAFHAWIPAEQLDPATELLFEMLFDSRFDPTDYKKEREVVLQELRSYADNPDEEFTDSLLEVALKDHPLGRRVAGFPAHVRQLRRETLLDYVETGFLRAPLVVSVVSPYAPEEVFRRLKAMLRGRAKDWKWTGSLQAPRRRPSRSLVKVPTSLEARTRVRAFDSDQVQFAFVYPAVKLSSRDEIVWSALTNWLGGGSSSQLYREVRERRGLAYSVNTQMHGFTDCGFLVGYFATEPAKFREALQVSAEVCRAVPSQLRDEDVDFLRSMMRGSVLMSYDGINSRMESLARQELLMGRTYSLRESLAEIEGLTRRSIVRVAKQVAAQPPCAFALGRTRSWTPARLLSTWHAR
jgi:predicted Zn-dependent peptidase